MPEIHHLTDGLRSRPCSVSGQAWRNVAIVFALLLVPGLAGWRARALDDFRARISAAPAANCGSLVAPTVTFAIERSPLVKEDPQRARRCNCHAAGAVKCR